MQRYLSSGIVRRRRVFTRRCMRRRHGVAVSCKSAASDVHSWCTQARCGGNSVAMREARTDHPNMKVNTTGASRPSSLTTLLLSRAQRETHAKNTSIHCQKTFESYATQKHQSKCFLTKIPPLYVPSHPTFRSRIRPFFSKQPPESTSKLKLISSQLISQCTANFKSRGDLDSLLRISDSLSTLSQFRSQNLQSLQGTLSKLSRTHQTLSSQHNHVVAQHNPTDHASTILKLDTEKFKIAKQASDLEIEGERLQSELSRLGNVLGELEAEGVEGGERERGPEEDATVYVYHRTSPNVPIPISTSIPVTK
jgi:hypothetical protein